MKHAPRTAFVVSAVFALSALLAAGCGDATPSSAGTGTGPSGDLAVGEGDVTKNEPGKADSSAVAVFLDFDFQGELVTDASWNAKSQIEDQLLYTIGHLNQERSVGRLDKLELTDVNTADEGDRTKVTYQAKLQVAWGKRDNVPTEYVFKLPRDISYAGQKAFTEKYSHGCVDSGAHDVTPGSMWYYYRPGNRHCELDDADVVKSIAQVSLSPVSTTGKYPEYHRIWKDGVFNVVAVFGKYEDGATSGDAGITGYNRFHKLILDLLRDRADADGVSVEPTDAPSDPGVSVPEISYRARLDADHEVVVTAILVDNVRTAGADFNRRYGELSSTADLIAYNGHAGLGANIRALARKGHWVTGQHVVVFMNGCDTYAYVDTALFEAHADVNEDDPAGTKYVDIVTNAMPSFFSSMSGATMALVKGLVSYDAPLTYEQIFQRVDRSEVVLVSGEEDNEYVPGFDPDDPQPPAEPWDGVSREGELARAEEDRFETPALPAGSYTFTLTGTGDADLYVRTGLEPTTSEYDCRPYKTGSNEACKVALASPASIHVMVRGYSATSSFELVGQPD